MSSIFGPAVTLIACTMFLTACGGGSSPPVSSTSSSASSVMLQPSSISSAGDSSSSTSSNTVLAGPTNISVDYLQIKRFLFKWEEVEGATSYNLLGRIEDGSDFDVLVSGIESAQYELEAALHRFGNASFRIQACSDTGCTGQSESVYIDGSNMVAAVGYFKAPITRPHIHFSGEYGYIYSFNQLLTRPVLSADGKTLAMVNGADYSDVPDLNADIRLQSPHIHHAVYVFRLGESGWKQEAILKCRADEAYYQFSTARPAIGLSADGKTLAVGVHASASVDTGGVVCIFKEASGWQQTARIQSSKTARGDLFGGVLSLSADGKTLAVGAPGETGMGVGVNGEAGSIPSSSLDGTTIAGASRGAVFIFQEEAGVWIEKVYLKAMDANSPSLALGFGAGLNLSKDGTAVAVTTSGYVATDRSGSAQNLLYERVYIYRNIGSEWTFEQTLGQEIRGTSFGRSLAFTADGRTLVIGESYSSYLAMFNDGEDLKDLGRVRVYAHQNGQWELHSTLLPDGVLKPTLFGFGLAVTPDGQNIAVCAVGDASGAVGIGGNPDDASAPDSGAVYFFTLKDGQWQQQAYIKPPNTDAGDSFCSVALSADGNTLAVGSAGEASAAEGINGDMQDNSASNSGAVYLY